MDRFLKYIDKCIWIFLFLSVFILCSLFPYTADDISWGSESGIKLWNSGFQNYSGRYVGNIIVLLLTRSRQLRALVMTVFIVGLDYMIVKISDCKQYISPVIIALLFAAPKTILRETIAWTSGFSIYTTSITLFVLYVFLIAFVYSDQNMNKRRLVSGSVLFFCLGYLSAMIVEHVTIMQIILGTVILFWAWIKKKRFTMLYFFYPLGSVLGAITMFSNECYAAAVAGTDFYRSIPTNIKGLYERMCAQYFGVIGKQMILDNIILELFVAAVITILSFQKIEEWKERRYVLEVSVMLVDISVLYGLVTRVNTSWSKEGGFGKHIDGFVNVIFWLALFLFTVFILVEESKKAKMLLVLFGIACANGCLLFVSPINPRCFFVSYVLLIWYCAECMSLIILKQELGVIILGISLLSTGLVLCMNLNIYGALYMQDKQRLEIIRQAEREKKEEVVLQRFKYGEDYLVNYMWEKDFNAFYGISPELKIRYEQEE